MFLLRYLQLNTRHPQGPQGGGSIFVRDVSETHILVFCHFKSSSRVLSSAVSLLSLLAATLPYFAARTADSVGQEGLHASLRVFLYTISFCPTNLTADLPAFALRRRRGDVGKAASRGCMGELDRSPAQSIRPVLLLAGRYGRDTVRGTKGDSSRTAVRHLAGSRRVCCLPGK